MILASFTLDYALLKGTLVLYQDAGLGHMYQQTPKKIAGAVGFYRHNYYF